MPGIPSCHPWMSPATGTRWIRPGSGGRTLAGAEVDAHVHLDGGAGDGFGAVAHDDVAHDEFGRGVAAGNSISGFSARRSSIRGGRRSADPAGGRENGRERLDGGWVRDTQAP